MKKIGFRLRKARWDKNITIAEISQKCHMDKRNIINIELNNTMCRVDTLFKICQYTGISADYLLGFTKTKYLDDISKNENAH